MLATYPGDPTPVTATTPLNVANTPPTVVSTATTPVTQGAGSTLSLTVTSVDAFVQGEPYWYTVSINGVAIPALAGAATTAGVGHPIQIAIPATDIPDHGNFTISGTVTDAEGGRTSYASQVVVNPVAEQLTVAGAPTVPEGSPYTLTLGSSHPAPESVQYWIIDWGDGTTQQVTVSPSAPPSTSTTATHVYPLNGTYQIGLTAVDQSGPTTTSASVVVAPVAPTLTLNPVASVPLGTSSELTGVVGEPGQAETLTLSIDWGDGSQPTVITVPAAQPGFDLVHQYPTAANFTITGTVTDPSNQQGTATVAAPVVSSGPAITAASFTSASIPEGGLVEIIPGVPAGNPPTTIIVPAMLTGTVAPTLPTDTDVVSVAWGDGTTSAATVDNTTHTFSATHIYADNPPGQPSGSFTAAITATDENNKVASADASIQVVNQAPVVTTFAPTQSTINEAGTVTVDGTFTDPGVLDTHTAVISWGDGSSSAATLVEPAGGQPGTFVATHVYANNLAYVAGSPVPYTMTATVTDNDQGKGTATAPVTVDNVLPVVDNLSTNPTSPNDHSAFVLTGHVTDPGTQDSETVLVAWGDGTTSTVSADPVTRLFSVSHTYAGVVPSGQSSQTETITATATDDVGPGAPTSLPISVQANQLGLGPLLATPNVIDEGTATTVSGTFTTPTQGATYTVVFTWGDGTSSAGTVDDTKDTFTATHVYANQPAGVTSGEFQVNATLSGTDGVNASRANLGHGSGRRAGGARSGAEQRHDQRGRVHYPQWHGRRSGSAGQRNGSGGVGRWQHVARHRQ